MSRTHRVYNKKALDGGPGYSGWVVSNKITRLTVDGSPYSFRILEYACYHPYAQWSMKGPVDWKLSKKRRLRYKSELRELVNRVGRDCWKTSVDED